MLRALFIDFNSYFASVEQQEDETLRGRPVGVVPLMAETTCCIAASYEAKKFGVKTGTRVADARTLCPDIVLVQARHELYIRYHHRLVAAVDTCVPVKQVMSIDEMVCELTGSQQQRARAEALARQVKTTIARDVGAELRCSIGIAPNTFLAKTASDMQKPDGLVVIEAHTLPQCLHGLALRDLYGVGPAMEARLHAQGIGTVAELCAANKATLRKVWGGIEGERMHARLRGESVYVPHGRRASVGHSHVLPPEMRNPAAACAVLHKLLQKAAMRLRSYDCVAGGLDVQVKCLHDAGWTDQAMLDPTDDSVELTRALDLLWRRRPRRRLTPYAVGVTLFRLTPARYRTLSLFDNDAARAALNAAIDRINTRYGKNTIYFGDAHRALEAAPMRIAFTHIPDLVTESDT